MRQLHAGGIHRHYILTRQRFRAARDLIVAADRMRDHWAEADDARKKDLWRALHRSADDLREALD